MKKNYFTLVLAILFANIMFAQTTAIWGGAGTKDGEFDGGLNNWTTVGVKSDDPSKAKNALWEWEANATLSKGAIVKDLTLASASKANGAAVFNSDFLDNGGASTGSNGAAPAPQISELISPKIDLSKEKDVAIVFSQNFINFSAKGYIEYSRDNGATWSGRVLIMNNEVAKRATQNTALKVRVALPNAGNTANFKFKFVFDGDYYAWIIDDVSVVKLEDYNLRCNRNFFAVAENFNTPLAQARPYLFLNDIENVGAKPQSATHYIAVNQGATNVFRDSLKYSAFPIDSAIENKLFAQAFTPKTKGAYTAIYSIKGANADFDATDNVIQFPFSVSDSTFAKERARSGSIQPSNSVAPGKDASWAFGNAFFVEKGKGYKSGTIEFALTNASALKGVPMTVTLREWEDTDADSSISSMDELKIVGLLDYTIVGTEKSPTLNSIVTKLTSVYTPNFDFANKPILLKDNTYYIAMLEFDGTANPTTTPAVGTSNEFDFLPTFFTYAGEGKAATFTSLLNLPGDSGAKFYRSGYGVGSTPMIRWNVVAVPSNIEDVKLAETAVKVGPNPSSDYINVAFNFENTMQTVEVRIVDAAGRTISTQNYKNIQTDNVTIDLNKYTNGMYEMYIKTDTGVTTKTFVVQK